MKINHVIRPHSIRLYKLTLVKQGIHIDFNICIDSSRSNSKVREEEYLEWVLILSYTMASGTLYFIGSYMAFENPLKPKEISDAWMEQSRKLSTIKKIEDSRFLSTLCMTMKVTKEKREQKDSTYHIYLVYCYSLDEYDGNMQTDEILLLYKGKLSLFYNVYHNSFLNTGTTF